jgi:hypothetical protein
MRLDNVDDDNDDDDSDDDNDDDNDDDDDDDDNDDNTMIVRKILQYIKVSEWELKFLVAKFV